MLIKPTELLDSDKNCLALHFFFIRAFCFLFIALYLTSETISSNELKFSYYLSQSHIVKAFCCTTETFGQGERYPLAARNSLLKENWNTQNKDPLKKHSLAGCLFFCFVLF